MDASDLARIRFVTSRHGELQGRRQVVIVLVCLFSFWSRPYIEGLRYLGPFESIVGLLVSILPLVIAVAARPVLNGYYARRFGSVAGSASPWSRDMIGWAVVLVGGAIADNVTYRQSPPIAFLIAGALVALHIVVRDWPWRAHYVLTAGVCALAAWFFATQGPGQVTNVDELVRGPFSLMIVAHLVGACFDHRLLVRAMPRHADSHDPDLAADHADAL